MAEKRPLCQYSGTIEELRVGDTTIGGASGGAGAIGVAPEYITANKTLTSSSSGYQVVDKLNDAVYTLTLPDATTIGESAIMFIVQNDSFFNLLIENDDGVYIGSVQSKVTAAFSLEDNATTHGTWERTFEYTHRSDIVETDGVVFESASTTYISVTTLSATQALVCYQDSGNSSYGTACILDISGSTITPGTPVVFNSATTEYISVTTLSATQALVCYATGSCILNISGSTVFPETVLVATNRTLLSVTTLSSYQALVCYSDSGNSNYGATTMLSVGT